MEDYDRKHGQRELYFLLKRGVAVNSADANAGNIVDAGGGGAGNGVGADGGGAGAGGDCGKATGIEGSSRHSGGNSDAAVAGTAVLHIDGWDLFAPRVVQGCTS